YYGGTTLNDVPAPCALIVASPLLLAGGRNPNAWIARMFFARIALGIPPLHIVIPAPPPHPRTARRRSQQTLPTRPPVLPPRAHPRLLAPAGGAVSVPTSRDRAPASATSAARRPRPQAHANSRLVPARRPSAARHSPKHFLNLLFSRAKGTG